MSHDKGIFIPTSKELFYDSDLPILTFKKPNNCDKFFLDFCNVLLPGLTGVYRFQISEYSLGKPNFRKNNKEEVIEIRLEDKYDTMCIAVGYLFYEMGYRKEDRIEIEGFNTFSEVSQVEVSLTFDVDINGEFHSVRFIKHHIKGMEEYFSNNKYGRTIEIDDTRKIRTYELDRDRVTYRLVGVRNYLSKDLGYEYKKREDDYFNEYYTKYDGKEIILSICFYPWYSDELKEFINGDQIIEKLSAYLRKEITRSELLEYVLNELALKLDTKSKEKTSELWGKSFGVIDLKIDGLELFISDVISINKEAIGYTNDTKILDKIVLSFDRK